MFNETDALQAGRDNGIDKQGSERNKFQAVYIYLQDFLSKLQVNNSLTTGVTLQQLQH